MESEIDVLQVEKRIRTPRQAQMEKTPARVLPQRADEGDPEGARRGRGRPDEIAELEKRIKKTKLPKEARDKAQWPSSRSCAQMSPMSAEATVVRNYIDWLLSIPWKKRSKVKKDIAPPRRCSTPTTTASRRSRSASSNTSRCSSASTSCAADPVPGRSARRRQDLARQVDRAATGRKFVRMSLGGVRDEAEIRGHRRTYIGSMPGKIIQSHEEGQDGVRTRCSCSTRSTRWAPTSAAIRRRRCSRCSIPSRTAPSTTTTSRSTYDLSDVMFVTTANTLNIPQPLMDRMEIIRIPATPRTRRSRSPRTCCRSRSRSTA
jgi:ATP-dependent Lon protease